MAARPRRSSSGSLLGAGRPVHLLLRLAVLAFFTATFVPAALDAASRPPVQGSGGAVSSDERLATEAGLEILRAGGNAVDAAVATALAMAVVGPEAGNLGGGGFVVLREPATAADEARVRFLDFREIAPAAAHRDMYLGEDGEPVRDLSWNGPLAAGVPGSPRGLWELHNEAGKLPWKAVVAPAIRLANDGFPLSRRTVISLEREVERLARFPESAARWLPDGAPPAPGTTIRLPALAATLEKYAARGPEALVEGEVAQQVVATSSAHGGILTLDDLASYRPAWRDPVRFEAFGWQLAAADLPSSGGMILAASSWILEGADIGATEPLGAGRVHLLAEAWRRAFADRYLLGDPSSTRARTRDLLDPAWLARRAENLRRDAATPSREVQLWADAAETTNQESPVNESPDTTHIAVVDAEGRAVALTTTLNGLFGGALWVPGFGFLNNEMDDFAAKPGTKNEYDLVQGEANAVAPGQRMLSSMSPMVAWRSSRTGDGVEEVLSVGGRGGSRIPTATLQAFLAVAVDGAGLQEALDRPRVHHQWLPDVLYYEPGALSPETRAALERLGHVLETKEHIAQVQMVARRADGTFEAAGDPRRGGGSGGVADPVH